jgi:hypothetical protein
MLREKVPEYHVTFYFSRFWEKITSRSNILARDVLVTMFIQGPHVAQQTGVAVTLDMSHKNCCSDNTDYVTQQTAVEAMLVNFMR